MEVQQLIYQKLFDTDENIVTRYTYDRTDNIKTLGDIAPYQFTLEEKGEGMFSYSIDVSGRQTLYFDCFDKLSTSLNEKINGSFDIRVNGLTKQSDYPSQRSNGLIELGTFENQRVIITLSMKKSVSCSSFGVFGIDLDKLENSVQNARTAELQWKGGTISGNFTAQNGEKLITAIPYTDNLSVRVNGEEVSYSKVFGDMVSFELEEGENEIEISSIPKGFTVGVIISICGIILSALYIRFGKKITPNDTIQKYAKYAVRAVGGIVIILFYVVSVVICVAN